MGGHKTSLFFMEMLIAQSNVFESAIFVILYIAT